MCQLSRFQKSLRQRIQWLILLILHIWFWACIYCWEWPQTSWIYQADEPDRCTSLPPKNAALPAEIWCHHQAPPWQGDGDTRCPLPPMHPWCPTNTPLHCHKTKCTSLHKRNILRQWSSNPLLCSLAETILPG